MFLDGGEKLTVASCAAEELDGGDARGVRSETTERGAHREARKREEVKQEFDAIAFPCSPTLAARFPAPVRSVTALYVHATLTLSSPAALPLRFPRS